ncbi:hypothetical protein YB2330_006145 [Saitoella coloradoensis]
MTAMISNAPEINKIIDAYTSKPNGIPGLVARAITKDGSLLYEHASGVRDLDNKDQPLTMDTVFWIASFTKLVTTIAAMQCVERGEIELDVPAEQYLPDLGTQRILTHFDDDGKPVFKEPKTKITVRMMLTHTSGHTYDFFNENTLKWNKVNGILGNANNATFGTTRDAIEAPLGSEPGTKFEYGVGLDWVGFIIERISGMSLDAYFKKHILEPIGAKSTSFVPTAEMVKRHSGMHKRDLETGILTSRHHAIPLIENEIEVHFGGGGLHSTAEDYCRVLQVLLNDGTSMTGAKILEKSTVESMFIDQTTPLGISIEDPIPIAIPELHNPVPNLMPGVRKGWGLSFLISHDELPTGRSAGSVWWAGIANCFWWIDRVKGVAGVNLTQVLPMGDLEVAFCWMAWETALYKGLQEKA